MNPIHGDKLRGHLETMVLSTLEGSEAHGLEILRRLEVNGCGLLRLKEGSLYPALYRMEKKGWIEAEWGLSELGRRAKFYRLTPKGRRHLAAQTAEWSRFAAAISRVLLTN